MRVLVIEDDDEIASSLVLGLEEEGFEVARAADGRAGWQALQDAAWDAVLLDRTMPVLSGDEVLRRLRASHARTPVIVVSARDAVEDRVVGLDAGADDYLCKPFAFNELLARLRAVERRRSAAAEAVASFGDVSVDLATHRAERAGHALGLTSREAALLVFFLRNPREPHSRHRLYREVWGERVDVLSNTLEVHVAELRKKLEEHGPRVIHTLRGRGYVYGTPEDAEAR